MEPSIQIGRMFGIDLRLHISFVLVVYYTLQNAEPLTPVRSINALFLLLVLLICVILHEIGHALAARWCGIHTPAITLWGLGGIAHLERTPARPLHDLLISLAGPLVTFGIAVGAFVAVVAIHLAALWTGTELESASRSIDLYDQLTIPNTLAYIGIVNIVLLLFNLLPALPLDGGRALRALLAMMLRIDTVNKIMTVLSRVIAMIVLALGIVRVDTTLIVVAALIFVLAATPVTYSSTKRRT